MRSDYEDSLMYECIPVSMKSFLLSMLFFFMLEMGKQAHKILVRERVRVFTLPDVKSNYQYSCSIVGISRGAKFNEW